MNYLNTPVLILFFLFLSCNPEKTDQTPDIKQETKYTADTEEKRYSLAKIIEVNAPPVSKANVSVPIEVIIRVTNGCGQFHKFFETQKAGILFVKAEARYPEDRLCTQNLPKRTAVYNFTPFRSGVHELKFLSPKRGGTAFDTIPVLIDVYE